MAVFLAACGDSPRDGTTPDRQSRDSAGVAIHVDARSIDELPRLAEISTSPIIIGDDESNEAELFAEIGPIAVHAEHGIVIADPVSDDIRRFGWDGGYISLLGGPGEGPGEFGSITSLQGGSSLRVWDWSRGRLTEFDWDGSLVGELGISRTEMPWGGLVASTDDGFVAVGHHVLDAPDSEDVYSLRSDSLAIRVITDAGDSVSSLGRFPADEWVQIRKEFEGGIVLASNMLRPLGDRVFLRTSGDRILLARGAPGEVRTIRPDGSLTEIWRFPGLRQAATPDALSRWTELRAREVPDREVDDLRGILEAFPPSEMPAFVALIVGADGSIWLGMPSVGPSRPWAIMSSEGALRGYIELPRELDLRAATNEKVVGVVTDALGVDRVRVYDLLPAF